MEFVEEETYATATQVDAPWHLDILDQESIMFNGLYSPIGDGDGVDIYILDTGTIYIHVHYTWQIFQFQLLHFHALQKQQ